MASLAASCTRPKEVVRPKATPEVVGPHPVEFIYRDAAAKAVFLAGDFNGWNTTSTPMQRGSGNEWATQVTIKPGYHQYKFVVDGRWTADPANNNTAPDTFGGNNSTLTVNPGAHQDGGAERSKISGDARRLFLAGDFAAIEKHAAELRARKARLRQGAWELAVWYRGLNGANYAGDDEQKWRETLAAFDAWKVQFPNSITAPVARAHTLVDYAWKARGTGWAGEVSDQGWKLMRERLQEARSALEAAAQLPERCPEWYSAMQAVALGQSWKRDEYDRLFDEAVAREPTYYDYYFNKAYYLTPRWFGHKGEWESFAADAASRYGKDDGLTLYSRIAWSKAFLFGNLFRESAIEWPKMRNGFRDIERRWPESAWNKNNFCHFACKAEDHATAAELFKELGEQLDYDVWHSRSQFEAARRWANTDATSPSVHPQYRRAANQATRATALAAPRGGTPLYVGQGDGTVARWDPEAGRDFALVAKFDANIMRIAVAPGGELIAVALDEKNGKPGSVQIIDSTGATIASIEGWDGGAPFALAFSADGSTLAAVGGRGGKPGIVKIWNATNNSTTPVAWQPKHLLISAALSPDGRFLMTNDDCNVHVWDLHENKLVFRMNQDTEELVQGVAFSSDGKIAVAVTSADAWTSDAPGLLLAWKTADWTELKRMPIACGAQHLSFSRGGEYVAASRRDNSITIWRTSDWRPTTEILPIGGYIPAFSFYRDSETVALATFDDGFSMWQPLPSTR